MRLATFPPAMASPLRPTAIDVRRRPGRRRTLRRHAATLTAASLAVAGLLIAPAPATAASLATTTNAAATSPASAFGASINGEGDVGRLSTLLGRPFSSARVFLHRPASSWSSSALLRTVPANGTVAVSFNGGTPAQVRTFLAGHPSSTTCYANYFHEPEDNFTSIAQKAAYRAAWHAYAPAIRAAGCIPTLVLMKWSLSSHSGRNWHDWYPGAGDIDVLAWDAYNTEATSGGYSDPTSYLAPILAVQAETHLPWALTELGSDIAKGTSSSQRAAWAHGVAVTAAADPHFLFADWWDSQSKDGRRDYRLDHNAAQVWHP